MRNFSKIVVSLVLTFVMFSSFAVSNTYAATVGSTQLKSPEAGWTRIVDSNPLITYGGTWEVYKDSAYSTGSAHATKLSGSTANFWFEGTKVRIIGSRNNNKSTDMKIQIDGISYSFSALGSQQGDTLLFEKTDLIQGKHQVIITYNKGTSVDFVLSALDIDGQLTNKPVTLQLQAEAGDGQAILKWNAVDNATSYTVKYGTTSGDYSTTVTATKDAYGNFVVPNLDKGKSYYFVVSAVVNSLSTENSNEAVVAIPADETQPETGDRAILVVTMVNGLEKEFDLSITEVNSFISWYEAKQAGTGKASYAIDKHYKNKGPFSSRKDYVIFDKILTFEVSEYNS